MQPSKTIVLGSNLMISWRDDLKEKLKGNNSNEIDLDFQDIIVRCNDFIEASQICKISGKKLSSIKSNLAECVVSASSLGLKAELNLRIDSNIIKGLQISNKRKDSISSITYHQGTLRSGEVIESDQDLFVIGDVNPGAIVRANGNVMVWGRLLGTAHAGKSGNTHSKISALLLRPLQLRIADKVARGPNETPEPGLAEQAEIIEDLIVISPLRTKFQNIS